MKQLDGKTALVTGGNSGIGLATAKLFKSQGARVFITASSPKTYDVAQAELGRDFEVIQVDVSRLQEIEHLASVIREKAGHLDVVVANAGISLIKPIEAFSDAEYDKVFDINTKGLFLTVQKLSPLLRDGGSVVLMSSAAGTIGFAGGSVYGASKAAIRSFGRMWAAELGPRKIRVNTVSPALIETPIIEKSGLGSDASGFIDTMSKLSALKRLGQPEEVAEAILFLASSRASYINGVELMIDGGPAGL